MLRTAFRLPPVLSLILACSCLGAADTATEPALPPAASNAVETLQKEIGKTYAAYHAAMQKATERANKDLQRAMAEATRKGDLVTANAIKELVDGLAAGTLQERLEAQIKPDVDLLGDLPPAEDVLHTALAKGDWILDRSGTRNLLRLTEWVKPDGTTVLHWSCTNAPDVAITLANGIRLHFKSTQLGADTEFVSNAKLDKLTGANGWIIRRLASNEDLPETLDAPRRGPPGGANRP